MSADLLDAPGLAEVNACAPKRTRRRLLLGAGAIVKFTEAVNLLPLPAADARAWLRDQRLVRTIGGHEVVRWLDVLAALEGPDVEAAPVTRPIPRGTPGRVRL